MGPGLRRNDDGILPDRQKVERNQQNCPTGKSSDLQKSVKPRNKKYFAFPEIKIRAHLSPSRPNKRGVGHVTNVGRVAVDVEVP